MKLKHNKKRNTAFVYEALIKEATSALLKNNAETRNRIVKIIKQHFNPASTLYKDLGCYRSLYENQNLERSVCEKIVKEAKIAQRLIDPQGLFREQSALISDINKEVSSGVFANFVPNYKTLASIAQLFSHKLNPKDMIILENHIINDMMAISAQPDKVEAIDEIVVRKFIQKFNDKYDDELLMEQKELLSHYITSFTDNSLELKMFLNEEIARLKKELTAAKKREEFQADSAMSEKADHIIEKLNSFNATEIGEDVLNTIIKTQQLVKEIYTDADSN
tara:strand:- start:579 stop:1412 length:834 start_codon:yes stop_codon:yes gene_type:complete